MTSSIDINRREKEKDLIKSFTRVQVGEIFDVINSSNDNDYVFSKGRKNSFRSNMSTSKSQRISIDQYDIKLHKDKENSMNISD